MNTLFILIPAAMLLVACIVIAAALMKASTTRYYCACPAVPGVRCQNSVGGAGGVCHDCLSGRHGGHL